MKRKPGIGVWADMLAPVILYMAGHMLLRRGLSAFLPEAQAGAWASVLLLPCTALWYKRKNGPQNKHLSGAALLEAAGTALCFSLFSAGRTAQNAENLPAALAVLAAVLAGPITEEMLYRGGVYAVCKAHFGLFAAAALSALLFGAAHPAGFPEAASAGVLFVLLMERGGLGAAIFAHMLVNLLSFCQGLYRLPDAAYGLGTAGLAGIGVWLLIRVHSESKDAQS